MKLDRRSAIVQIDFQFINMNSNVVFNTCLVMLDKILLIGAAILRQRYIGVQFVSRDAGVRRVLLESFLASGKLHGLFLVLERRIGSIKRSR